TPFSVPTSFKAASRATSAAPGSPWITAVMMAPSTRRATAGAGLAAPPPPRSSTHPRRDAPKRRLWPPTNPGPGRGGAASSPEGRRLEPLLEGGEEGPQRVFRLLGVPLDRRQLSFPLSDNERSSQGPGFPGRRLRRPHLDTPARDNYSAAAPLAFFAASAR